MGKNNNADIILEPTTDMHLIESWEYRLQAMKIPYAVARFLDVDDEGGISILVQSKYLAGAV